MKFSALISTVVFILFFSGCASRDPENPSFPISKQTAKAYLKRTEPLHYQLQRPLIIVNGFHDLGIPSFLLAKRFRKIFDDDRILAVSIEGCHTFDQCRKRLLTAVKTRFPSEFAKSRPFDVVGISMGGLVSRYSAIPQNGERLVIHRLFTIGSPHQGSRLATLPALEPIQRDMRPNSPFLFQLSKAKRDYELFPYVRLRDEFVGVEAAAPSGMYPWWTTHNGILSAHASSFLDERFIADITARLLNHPPFSKYPPALAPASKS